MSDPTAREPQAGDYSTVGEYVRAVIQHEMRLLAQQNGLRYKDPEGAPAATDEASQ